MRIKWLVIVFLATMMSVAIPLSWVLLHEYANPETENLVSFQPADSTDTEPEQTSESKSGMITPEFFVGVDVAYADLNDIKELIDEVSSYTNLFVIGSTGISYNATKLDEVCQYLYDRDMYFISYSSARGGLPLASDVQDKYGDNFLGVYFDDEWGGKQLDVNDNHRLVNEASDYSDAANQFVNGLSGWLNNPYSPHNSTVEFKASDFPLFTSDYSLYWFDYKAGYDTVFAQFGWNYSRLLNVALCRGAATVQNKEWGAIVAWTYNNPPYLGSGNELFEDMKFAYDNGAKYVLVFDSDENYTHSILKEEHLDALRRFWAYVKSNPRVEADVGNRVAFVLPKDYGYGFRGPNDKVWGLWEADSFSYSIGENLGRCLDGYGTKLDIIFDDENVFDYNYSKYVFWDGSVYEP